MGHSLAAGAVSSRRRFSESPSRKPPLRVFRACRNRSSVPIEPMRPALMRRRTPSKGPASSRFLFGARVPQYDQFSHKHNALHVSLDM